MSTLSAVEATVRGLVQGVGFRAATVRRATQLGVDGWCSNEPDGSVRVFAQGEPAAVDALVRWLADGPRMAVVSEVTTMAAEPREHIGGFAVH